MIVWLMTAHKKSPVNQSPGHLGLQYFCVLNLAKLPGNRLTWPSPHDILLCVHLNKDDEQNELCKHL